MTQEMLKNMKDQPSKVLEIFNEYNAAFTMLKPKELLPYYHYPSMLISHDKSIIMKNGLEEIKDAAHAFCYSHPDKQQNFYSTFCSRHYNERS